MEMNFNSNGSSFMFGAEMYCEFNIQSIHSMIYLTKWWNENQPRAFVYFFFPGNRSKHSLYQTENSEYNVKIMEKLSSFHYIFYWKQFQLLKYGDVLIIY